ncbi:MAG: T9SS type A sorting domain-containing protein, partial [Bacteroidota bacterium]
GPDGVVLMDNEDILVANYNDNKVHRVTPAGTVSLFGRHPHLGNMGYIAKAKGYYYVPSIQRHTIARFDNEGNVEIFAGSTSQGYSDGPVAGARFTSPNGITANAAGDTLLVAEGSRIRFITGLEELTSTRLVLDPVQALTVFPQPFSTDLTLEYTSPRNAEVTVKIIDIAGKLCYTTTLPAMRNKLQRHVLTLPELPSGAYVLQLWEAGQLRQVREIIRQ